MNHVRLAIVGLALAGAAACIWWLLRGDAAAPATAVPPAVPAHGATAAEPAPSPVATSNGAPAPDRLVAPADALPGQGVRGRVVDAGGAPVAGARCCLFAQAVDDPFTLAALAARGVVEPPLAQATSDAAGAFALPLGDEACGGRLELRAIHERHGDARQRGLEVAVARWTAVEVVLPRGLLIAGAVRDLDSGAPLAGATVRLWPSAAAGTLRPTPGREGGLAAVTDAAGEFRLDNATAGVCDVSAEAAGHATVELLQQHVVDGEPNRIDFELSAGAELRGRIVDEAGSGIAGAWVQAQGLERAERRPFTARGGPDGQFALRGLEAGSYRLAVGADGYRIGRVPAVVAGATDLRVVLAAQGGVRVRVRAPDGTAVQRYTLAAARPMPPAGALLRAPGVRPRRVEALQLDGGCYAFRGLDPGAYRLRVEAPGFACTLSDEFAIGETGAMPEVVVVLAVGGRIEGRLTGADGRPVAGAVIATVPAATTDAAVAATFGPLLVESTTAARTQSGADGAFALVHLAAGGYRLRVVHPDFATQLLGPVEVADAGACPLGDLVLARGALLTGTCSCEDRPAAGALVQVVAVDVPALPPGFVGEATADADGRWQLAGRLPAGSYRLDAGRRLAANPLLESADRQQSRSDLRIEATDEQRAVTLRWRSSAR